MEPLLPPHLESALNQLRQALQEKGATSLDLLTSPWSDIERGVTQLLGGPFDLENPEHQSIVMGLAAALGGRLLRDFAAFWFPNRDAPEGAAIGFADAMIVLSPFGAVADALTRSKLELLDNLANQVRGSLAQARFDPTAQRQMRLSPDDYRRFLDAGFLQFTLIDLPAARRAWQMTPEKLGAEVADALARVPQLPDEARQSFDAQLKVALSRLNPQQPVIEQLALDVALAELLGHLYGAVDGTGFAPEEFWQEIVFPLLHIGAPTHFPPLDADDIKAFEQGVDPLALYVDLVPFQTPSVEEGLLGVFPLADTQLPDPAFNRAASLKLIRLDPQSLERVLPQFDPEKTRESVKQFAAYLQSSLPAAAGRPLEVGQMLEVALTVLSDFKRVASLTSGDEKIFCLRRLTEAEAASEPVLSAIRDALRAPRIIL
jgi:hypothetical protein